MTTPAQSLTSSITSTSNRRSSPKAMNCDSDTFPAGLRVLVVDDDPICLLILDRMLRHCQYQVTICGKATEALAMLRENRHSFDLVISDVCMPDMDGFKLLELVGLEMDLPVIMMSANGETSAVMKGIKHGACDYLLKPVRIEELRNIWQHVVRRKWRNSGQSCISEEDKSRQLTDDGDRYSSANESMDGSWNKGKKRKDAREEDDDVELDNDDPSTAKKPRVVWSVDLHQQFVNAVKQLGIDKAVPKRILELMNVHGLTRENVASHLQKYRLYLKRISGGSGHQPGVINPSFPAADANFGSVNAANLASLNELRALTGPSQLSPQALISTFQTDILGRLGSSNLDPSILLQLALQGTGNGGLTRASSMSSYNQPSANNQSTFQPAISDTNSLQAANLGAFGGPVDKGSSGLSSLQQQLAANQASLGGIGQLSVVNNSVQQVNPSSNPLLMQQQQISKSGLAMPTGGIVSKPGLTTETSAWASGISNASSSCIMTAQRSSIALRQGPVTSVAGNSSVSDGLRLTGRTTDAEIQGLQKPSAGQAIVRNSLAVPLPMVSSGLNGSSHMLPYENNDLESKYKLHPGLKQDQMQCTGPKPQGRWQGFGLAQDHGQVSNNQACLSSGAQTLTSNVGQEQNQSCNTGFNGPSSDSLANGRVRASQSDDFRLEHGLKVKEEGDEWLPERESDELLSIVLKQVRS